MLVGVLTAILSTVVGAFAPTLVSLYIQYLKEPDAPKLLSNYPYRIPFIGMGTLIALSVIALVCVSIREHRRKIKTKSDFDALRERIDILERKNTCDI